MLKTTPRRARAAYDHGRQSRQFTHGGGARTVSHGPGGRGAARPDAGNEDAACRTDRLRAAWVLAKVEAAETFHCSRLPHQRRQASLLAIHAIANGASQVAKGRWPGMCGWPACRGVEKCGLFPWAAVLYCCQETSRAIIAI
jgi:hypothetical protein